MGALDIKIGEILEQGRNLTATLEDLRESTKVDHDALVMIKTVIEEDRKTFYKRISDLQEEFRQAEQLRARKVDNFLQEQANKELAALDAKKKADEIVAKRQEKTQESKRKVFHSILLKVVGAALTMAGAYVAARYGIKV